MRSLIALLVGVVGAATFAGAAATGDVPPVPIDAPERLTIVDLRGNPVDAIDPLKLGPTSIISPLWIWRQAAGAPVADAEPVTDWFGVISWDDLHEDREYIFWFWSPSTHTFGACDNHPDFQFSGFPDGHAELQFLDLRWIPERIVTAPHVVQEVGCQGTSNGDIVGYDFTVFVVGSEATSCHPSADDCELITELDGPWWGDVTFALE